MEFRRIYNTKKAFLTENSKINRRPQTKPENILWNALRRKSVKGHKFRRQHPILDYIADFYCPEKKLVIEVDGDIHLVKENQEYDNVRTRDLESIGITVLRFTNAEIVQDINSVLAQIEIQMQA